MKQLSAEACIEYILRDIDKRRTVDYADKNSVRRYNAAMDRIVSRANFICENYPDKMELLVTLLDHPDYQIAATCTSVLFGLRSATKEHKLAAIKAARRFLLRPELSDMEIFIWTTNIDRWETEIAK